MCQCDVAKRLQAESEKDEAYLQRNYLVAALAHLFPSGIRPTNLPGWEQDWHGCVYIDLPTGQISYHYHDSQAFLFEDLPPYAKDYDGHDKETVHGRLLALGLLGLPPMANGPSGNHGQVGWMGGEFDR